MPCSLKAYLRRGDEGWSFNATYHSMTWLGVGNVEGIIVRADHRAIPAQERIPLFPGVAGYELPFLRAVVTLLTRGDLVVFYTDGIRGDVLLNPNHPKAARVDRAAHL